MRPSLPRLAALAVVLCVSLAEARFQRFTYTDSAGVKHVVDLPSSLEPDPGESFLYLDSAMQVDTIDYAGFEALDSAGRTGMKYGRLLGFSLTRASKAYGAPLPDIKAKAVGDPLFQIRMLEAHAAKKRRMVYAGIGGGTGLLLGNLLLQFGLPRTECVSRNGGPIECDQTEANGSLIGTGLAFMAAGVAVGGGIFMMEFDEEKLARRLVSGR
jgi:hypothetical protein